MCKEFNLKKSGSKSRVMPGKTSKPAGMRTASPIMNMSLVRPVLQRSAESGGSLIAENGATDLGQMPPLETQVLFNHLQRFCGNNGAGIFAGTSIVQSGGTETTRIQRMITDDKNDEKEDKSAEEIKGAGNEDMDWDECVRDLNRLAIDLSDYEPNFMSDFEEAKRLIGMADRTRNYLSDAERDPERYYLGPDFGANILEELDSSISDNSNEEYDDPSTEDD